MHTQLQEAPAPRFPFTSLPRGYFAIAFSDELKPGELRTLRYFSRDLVAYRGESGRVYVRDAYCPHLGAHLGHGGVVEGDSLRCPFHGWRFEGSGQCVEIPYSTHIPPRAALGTWPVLEQEGVVFVFHDPSGGPPWAPPPLSSQGLTPARRVLWSGLRTHAQEIFENTVDITHIGPVHGGRGARLLGPMRREAERLDIELEFEAPGDVVGMPGQLNDVHLAVRMHGLGWTLVETHVRNVEVRARQRIFVTPIDETHVDIRGLVQVARTDDAAFTEELARVFHEAFVEDFAKDFPIWENKRYLLRPRLAKGDGPVGTYRAWCEQFYEAAQPSSEPTAAALSGVFDVTLSRLREGARARLAQARERLWGRPRAQRAAAASSSAAPSPAAASSSSAAPCPAAASSAPSSAAPRPAPSATATAERPRDALPPIRDAKEYRDTLAQRFVPSAARGVRAVFQWELGPSEDETFHALVDDGHLEVRQGAHVEPTVALVIAAEDYVRVVNGELDGTKTFMSGRGKVRGSLSAAMKMRALFPA